MQTNLGLNVISATFQLLLTVSMRFWALNIAILLLTYTFIVYTCMIRRFGAKAFENVTWGIINHRTVKILYIKSFGGYFGHHLGVLRVTLRGSSGTACVHGYSIFISHFI